MNVTKPIDDATSNLSMGGKPLELKPLKGTDITIGEGFEAKSFRAQDIGAAMDPLVMVDHYIMTEPTFGTHPHAGLSAVSLILSDSDGRYHNRDSLGNNFDLMPGDLYWLKAGRGALHNESPREHSRTHGLQIFVNIPQENRHDKPASLLVRGQDMPLITNDQHSVRVVLGESNGVVGANSPGLPMTILDGHLIHNGSFDHELTGGRNAWVHAINSDVELTVAGNVVKLSQGQAVAVDNSDRGESIILRVSAGDHSSAHFVLLDGRSIKEPYVQRGPFVGGSTDEIEAFNEAFQHDRFGSIQQLD